MPFRERLRRAFNSSSSSKSSKSSKSSTSIDPLHYQPGEKMPPLKYRRPVDPEHKAKLESYSWAQAWRRKSEASMYSPMGSRLPSRKNSITTLERRSIGQRKVSFTEAGGDGRESAVDSGVGVCVGGLVREGSDEEGDVGNVGLSRQQTRDSAKRCGSSVNRRSPSIKSVTSRRRPNSGKDQQFTPDNLELALKHSHLEPSKEERESDSSGEPSPKVIVSQE
ncbi:hypothetical protein GQ43DRAFT_310631 [Delitschia confertaspora ATCC 74209]|uniref:Uncharacterized protein n=1 Tax=Delitschia confertaspora ATCC 74209 TaxID=1513339 RepID=A0A9P4MR27_9PLEO|nr:hypothetical protein GQ43DRAFT_310631 [Delitschia confertaspora ATCC 74209]